MLALQELLRRATRGGAKFRLSGSQVLVSYPNGDPELRLVLSALKEQRPALWAMLGGSEQDAGSIALLMALEVDAVVPRTEAEALSLIAEMEADSDADTPQDMLHVRSGMLGLDIETMANPGEEMSIYGAMMDCRRRHSPN